jgi:hypothetical protein
MAGGHPACLHHRRRLRQSPLRRLGITFWSPSHHHFRQRGPIHVRSLCGPVQPAQHPALAHDSIPPSVKRIFQLPKAIGNKQRPKTIAPLPISEGLSFRSLDERFYNWKLQNEKTNLIQVNFRCRHLNWLPNWQLKTGRRFNRGRADFFKKPLCLSF